MDRRLYTFDEFAVDPLRRVLLFRGQPVAIMPKALSTLLVLLERPGTIVAKDELLNRVWPDTTASEASLSQAIFWLRKSLSDHAEGRRYVVTVPGQGFTFAAEVGVVTPAPAPAPAPEAPPTTPAEPPPVELAPAPAPVSASAEPARVAPRRTIAVALALIVVAAGAWIARRGAGAEPGVERPAAADRPVVAILGPADLSSRPDSAWLSTALAEMLSTEIAAGAQVRVVPGATIAQAAGVLPAAAGSRDPAAAAAAALHGRLGADALVSGSYVVVGDGPAAQLRVDLRVVRLPGGEVQERIAEQGARDQLLGIVVRLGARLRAALGAGEPSDEAIAAAHAALPSNAEAARLLAEGLAALRRFDAASARDLLQAAAAADPESAPVRARLAEAFAALGHDAEALQEAERARALSGALPRADRLRIEAQRWALAGDWRKAAETYRSLWTFYPDDLESGLSLADALTRGGAGREALAVVAALRRLRPPLGGDARIDVQEALAAQSLADWETSVAAARRAVSKALAAGTTWIEAAALGIEAAGRRARGERAEALALLERSREMSEALGDRAGAADALTQAGVIAREEGRLDRARALYTRALETYQEIGYRRSQAAARGNLGVLEIYQGDLASARRHLEQAREDYVALGEPVGEAGVLAALGPLRALGGDKAAARDMAARLLETARRAGNRALEASALRNVGALALDAGAHDEALRHLAAADAIAAEQPNRNREAVIEALVAVAHARRGDLDEARARADEAVRHARAGGDPLSLGKALGAAHEVAFATGDLAAAQAAAEAQLALARDAGAVLLAAEARLALGRARLARGDLDAAAREVDEARRAREAAGEVEALAETYLLAAQVAAARGEDALARTRAQQALDLARRLDQRPLVARAQEVAARIAVARNQRP